MTLTTPAPPARAKSAVAPPERWHQRFLAAEIRRVLSIIGSDDCDEDDDTAAATAAVRAEAVEALDGRPPALDHLAAAFGLDPFERDVLVATAAPELEPDVPAPTFAALLSSHPAATWQATLPHRPLRAERLIRGEADLLLHAPLRIDERVLHHLPGVVTAAAVDERLLPYLTAVTESPRRLAPSRRQAVDAIVSAWSAHGSDCSPTLLVHGPSSADRRQIVAAASARSTRHLWLLESGDLPAEPVELHAFAQLVGREAKLTDAVLLVELPADPSPVDVATVGRLISRLEGGVIVSAFAPVPLPAIRATLALARPTRSEQRDLWREVLPGRDRGNGRVATRLAGAFDLDHATIDQLPANLLATGDEPGELARDRVRAALRVRLEGLAERVEVAAGWDDLVLAPTVAAAVRQMAAAAAGRVALEEQGFGRVTRRGLGVTALFAGPSGTGKTLAAEVIANHLDLDLYVIDLASVVSKWIGETEKQLRRVFDAAEQGGAVLLFDEADALFGRRSEVRDSHDRYANIEVSYLLQRMERYRGIAILTSNLRSAIDPAFLRRLRFVVQFSHPDVDQRQELWRRAFPASVPVQGLDLARLARLDLTGGDVRTISLHAALVSAAEQSPVTMDHLRDAVAVTFAKHERSLAELEGWS